MRFYNPIPEKNILVDVVVKWVADIVVVCVLALFCYNFFCGQTNVVGNSMNDILLNRDTVMVDSFAYRFDSPKRYDVVAFTKTEKNGDKVEYIKRIIGLPGDRIIIKDGTVYVNDKKISEKYIDAKIVNAGLASEEIKLDYDEYFVMGDNVNNSEDSRFSTVGNVKLDEIEGRIWLVSWPFARIRLVK